MERQQLEYGLVPPEELFELAASMRKVIERMVVIDEGRDELRQARTQMDEIERCLEAVGRKGLHVRMTPGTDPGPDDLRPYYAGNAVRWHYNPIFPPVRLTLDREGILRARLSLGLAYEGPPGCAHGGIVSLLLDQLLGQVNIGNGLPAMTASLKVTYHRPTPLLTELAIEAHPPTLVDGRKYVTRGWLRAGDDVTAEAEGLFVLPAFQNEDAVLPHLRWAELEELRQGEDDESKK